MTAKDSFAFLPIQLSSRRFAIPYYVVTYDATQAYQSAKDPLDATRYDWPDQTFEVQILNVAGTDANVSAYDPLTGKSVPVQVVSATKKGLRVKLLATDYPRVLLINEAAGGLQILAPQVSVSGPEQITVQWRTNLPVDSVAVNYGADWTTRDTREVIVKPRTSGQTSFLVRLPVGKSEVPAARIRVTAGEITTAWPQWDEDPRGQVVMPSAKPREPGTPSPGDGDTPGDLGPPTPLVAPPGVTLTKSLQAREKTIPLPASAVISGVGDDQTATLGGVTLRVRYLEGAANRASDYLPFVSATDDVTRRAVTLTNGQLAVLSEYTLAATAYPDVDDLRRRYLQIAIGDDLLLLAATGTPAAMQAQEKTVTAIFAGVR